VFLFNAHAQIAKPVPHAEPKRFAINVASGWFLVLEEGRKKSVVFHEPYSLICPLNPRKMQ